MLIENAEHDSESLERKLMPGAGVYAIGEYAGGDWAAMPVLKPWVPVRTGSLMRRMSLFLDRALFMVGTDAASSFAIGRLMEQALGIQFLRGVFLITNTSENRAKRMLFGRWRWNLTVGMFYMIVSGALLVMVMNGSILRFMW